MKNVFLIIIACLLVGVSLLAYDCGSKHGRKESFNALKSLNDTLTCWKDKNGLNHTKIASIELSRNELLTVLDEKEKEIKELLKNKAVTGVIKQGAETKFDTSIVAKHKPNQDTLLHDCSNEFEFDNGWIAADLKVHNDTLQVKNLLIRNELILSHEELAGKTIVHVKQANPYTQTTYLKEYTILHPQVKNNWLKHILIGIIIGSVAGLMIR